MAAGPHHQDDDEWEYEYSTTETETFYVDLDLSSVNGVIKSKNAGDRKSLKRPETSAKGNTPGKGRARPNKFKSGETQDQDQDQDLENQDDDDNAQGDSAVTATPAQAQSPQEPDLIEEDYSNRIQILDFGTTNPIISYNNQVYSCTWHDMLGTTMFITKHQETPFHEPDLSTEDYDLVGLSRIKLVGHRAKIVPKTTTSRKRRRGDGDGEEGEEEEDEGEQLEPVEFAKYIPDGRSLGTIKRTNPRTNIDIKQQATFLEKLMSIKKSRGETDTVRTFVDHRTVAADARQARREQRVGKEVEKQKKRAREETTEQRQRREIDELNKLVVKGDNNALRRLQEIYADMEEAEDDAEVEDDVEPIAENALGHANASTTIDSPADAVDDH